MSDTAIVNGTIAETRSERFTGALRWHDGILQQQVEMLVWRNGYRSALDYTWRDVPITTGHQSKEDGA